MSFDHELSEEFHRIYWLGKEPQTFQKISETMNIDIEKVRKLYAETKDKRENTKLLRQRWLAKFSKEERPPFGSFLDILNQLDAKCFYCGISQEQLDLMNEQGLLQTKRNRGSVLEIERLLPNEQYNNYKNLKYACYWCNNAKTDTFTCKEFMKIAKQITNVWNERLREANMAEIEVSEKPCP